jgi:hypothetical protein
LKTNRRNFLRSAAVTVSSAHLFPTILTGAPAQEPKVRLAFIGVGGRGRSHVEQALYRNDVAITAICDIDPEAINRTKAMISKAGRPEPAVFGKTDRDFENMLKRDDIDGVVIATPWEWHVPMSVATMKAGKYAGVEVSATVTLKESWDLIEAAEKSGMPCMILENVCYRRDVMAVLNMIRQGMFGEMLYAHCGYQHDLRNIKFNDGTVKQGIGAEFGAKGYSEARWRTQHSVDRNGDLYPTHGLGPVAHWLDINRGNRFTYLTSTATKSRGLHNYVVEKGGPNHPNAKVNFKLGDIVTTVLNCANGENIVIMHDTNSPRPYSLGFRAQGTKGIWMDDGKTIYLEGMSAKPHQWEPFKEYQEKYDHPVWKRHSQTAENAGHGGIDFFVIRAFIESVKRKVPPPIDVYDAAVWSAISPLSEESIAKGSKPIEIPDFTRGKWKTNKPIFALNDDY